MVVQEEDVTAVAVGDRKYQDDSDTGCVDFDLVVVKADGTKTATGSAIVRVPLGESGGS